MQRKAEEQEEKEKYIASHNHDVEFV